MSSSDKKIITVLIASTLLFSCNQIQNKNSLQPTTTIPIPTYITEKTLISNGTVVPELVSTLSFNTNGRIQKINVAVGSKVHAGDIVAELETSIQQSDVILAEKNLQSAQLEYDYKKQKATASNAKPGEIADLQYNLQLAEINVEKAKAELAIAQSILKDGLLISPHEGTIIEIPVRPGETVYTGNPIMVIADLSHLLIETTDFNEMDILQIYPGESVTVYIDALQTEKNGTIVKIAPQVVKLSESRVIKITIQLNQQPENLLWGMSTEIKFYLKNSSTP